MTMQLSSPVVFRDAINMRGASTVLYKAGSIATADISATADIARTQMAQNALDTFAIPLALLRVWDAMQTNLPGTASSDDLAIITGTLGSDAPTIQTSDGKATTVTQYARFQFALPVNYDAAETVTLRMRAGMVTTISDTSATLDAQVYLQDRDGAVGGDICATAAQSINALAHANYDFTITPTTLNPGDMLDIRIAIAITDSATGTAVIGEISALELLIDTRG